MNGASFLICLVLWIGMGVAALWAFRADRADAHLLHGPNDGCIECSDK